MLVKKLNKDVYFLGVCMIFLNLGSRYISNELTKTQEKFLSHYIVRKFTLFTVFFIATRDFKVSIQLTIR